MLGYINVYSSRFPGLDAAALAPRIYCDPENPFVAVITNYVPPPDLLDRFLKGDDRAVKEAYRAALLDGVSFRVGDLLRTYLRVMEDAARRRVQAAQALGIALARLSEGGAVAIKEARLSELVVHPYNARFISHTTAIGFNSLVEGKALRDPLLVVPVDDRDLARVHTAIFRLIRERAEEAAERDEDLKRLIEREGFTTVFQAFTGSRRVRLDGEGLAFAEDDRLRSITGVAAPKYFVIDGQLRLLAMEQDFIQGYNEGRYSREGDTVYVQVVEGADPVTVSHVTMLLNIGPEQLTEAAIYSYARIFGPIYARILRRVAEAVGSSAMISITKRADHYATTLPASGQEGKAYFPAAAEGPEPTPPKRAQPPPYEPIEVHEEEPEEEPTAPEKPKPRVEWEWPAPAKETPYEPAASRPESQLDDVAVVRELTARFLADPNLLQVFTIPTSLSVRLEASVKRELELLGERALGPDIRYVHIPPKTFEHGGARVRATLLAPIAWDKRCPGCRSLVVLAPARCLFCGEILDKRSSPFPYHLSYSRA